MSHPTPKQTAVWAAVTEHGSAAAAADVLGMSLATVYGHLRAYQDRTGDPYPSGVARRGTNAAVDRLRELDRKLDESLEAIQRDTRSLLALAADIVKRLERLEAAPRYVEVPAPTHRRKADGGVGGRRERRLSRRMLG